MLVADIRRVHYDMTPLRAYSRPQVRHGPVVQPLSVDVEQEMAFRSTCQLASVTDKLEFRCKGV